MKKTISITRIAILFTLGMVAFLLILGEEQDQDMLAWTLRFIADKTIGIGIFFFIARLYKRWSKIDPWLMAYDKMCDEVMEKPNPLLKDNNED